MTTVLAVALIAIQSASGAQAAPARAVEGFRYEAGRLPVGRVYHYAKSNVDGSRRSNDDLYVASETRLESFKWTPGIREATLVVAEMDWTTFSVARFETFQVLADGTRRRVASLRTSDDGAAVVIEGPGFSFRTPIEELPWHSYDFDFASLNVALRFVEEPEATVRFGVMDRHRGAFRHKGSVELVYLGDQERAGIPCRHYAIDGPGLEDRGGEVWVRRSADPVLVDYEIDLPDEPGMRSGKLRLLGEEELSEDAWQAHLLAQLK